MAAMHAVGSDGRCCLLVAVAGGASSGNKLTTHRRRCILCIHYMRMRHRWRDSFHRAKWIMVHLPHTIFALRYYLFAKREWMIFVVASERKNICSMTGCTIKPMCIIVFPRAYVRECFLFVLENIILFCARYCLCGTRTQRNAHLVRFFFLH